ncbi:MAG: TIGR04255 family protein [Gemmataceae bacterium]
MVSEHRIHFQRPPVIETLLGVQFEPLPKFRNAHLGVFWKRLGPEWTTPTDAPPLPPQFERFGETHGWINPGFSLQVASDLSNRMQFRNQDENRMVQVQNGRLHYNWLGRPGAEYPRFKNVRPEFNRILEELRRFVTDEGLGEIKPNQWEVTYVNRIPKGTVWNDPSDWTTLFRSLALLPANLSSASLESFGGEWHYEIPPKLGRLHMRIQHGRLATLGGEEVLTLTLTARGPVEMREKQGLDLETGLTRGHAVIVQSFKELTSDAAHEYWGLTHDDAGI